MKYFSKLPKRTFSTTIGDFTISDFFTRCEINYSLAQTQNTLVDNSTTLVELSQNIYEDNNSMWLILFANQTIDPFSLTAQNPTTYKTETQDKITTGLRGILYGSPSFVIGETSIITPYSGSTYGNKWEYSSVGNFNLDGPFTIVEKTDYYTGRMTTKPSIGGTVLDMSIASGNDSLAVIATQNDGSTYDQIGTENTTINKTGTAEEVAAIYVEDSGSVIASADNGDSSYTEVSSAFPPPPSTNTGFLTTQTNYEVVVNNNKYVKIFLPGKLTQIINNVVTFG